MQTQSSHVNATDGSTTNPGTWRSSQENIWDHMQCSCRCAVMFIISETNDWRGIWETIIIPPTCAWHRLCIKMNAAEMEWSLLNCGPLCMEKGVLWYLHQRTFQFQSHSQHLWLQSSPSHIMNFQYFIGSCHSAFNIIFSRSCWTG